MIFLLFSIIICQFSFQHAETTMSFHCLRCSLCFWLNYAQHHRNVGWLTQMDGFSKIVITRFSNLLFVIVAISISTFIYGNKTHAWRCLLHINSIKLVQFLMHLIQSTFRHMHTDTVLLTPRNLFRIKHAHQTYFKLFTQHCCCTEKIHCLIVVSTCIKLPICEHFCCMEGGRLQKKGQIKIWIQLLQLDIWALSLNLIKWKEHDIEYQWTLFREWDREWMFEWKSEWVETIGGLI